jgi:hypothetical protein
MVALNADPRPDKKSSDLGGADRPRNPFLSTEQRARIAERELQHQAAIAESKRQVVEYFRGLGYTVGSDVINLRLLAPKNASECLECADSARFKALHRQLWYHSKKKGKDFTQSIKCRIELDGSISRYQWGENIWKKAASDWHNWLHYQNKGPGLAPYVIVNPGGQTEPEISHFRTVFWEGDSAPKPDQMAQFEQMAQIWNDAGFVVETAKGLHCFFRLSEDGDRALFKPIQERIIAHLGSDPIIKDLPRLMRVPGFDHTKFDPSDVTKFIRNPVRLVREWNGNTVDLATVVNSLPELPIEPRKQPKPFTGTNPPATDEEILRALSYIPTRSRGTYEIFRNLLWALKSHFGEAMAVQIMEAHSPSKGEFSWPIEQVGRSGGKDFTIATVFYHAKKYGYTPSRQVRF